MMKLYENISKEKGINSDIFALLSKYRTTLMGIAMLWVVLHHCNCNTHYNLNFLYAFPLLNLGYSGVDIFLLLSGFGIYCSLNKMSDVAIFLWKRFKRFIPSFAIVIIYILHSQITSLHEIIGFFTFENFWVKDGFLGYLSYAFFFYLLSPIIKNILDNHIKQNIYKLMVFLLILFIYSIPYIGTGKLGGICRILIYTFGMFLGYCHINKIEISKKFISNLIYLAILGFIILAIVFIKFSNIRLYYGLVWYPEILFISGLCFSFVIIIDYLKKILSFPLKILNIIGKYSLTIYCIDYFITTCIEFKTFWIHFVLSVFLGIIYGFLYDMILNLKIFFIKKELN